MTRAVGDLQARVFEAVANLAAQASAEKWLAELGASAIAPLSVYLDSPPASIPQARCFAVSMLARLPDAAATDALRRVLYAWPLADLEPVPAQAEFVVKNDAVTALARRRYLELERDLGYALDHERLPAAARAAGALHLTSLGTTLATLLDDDTLAAPAAQALAELGGPGRRSLLAALQVRLEARETGAGNCRVLIRVLLALGRGRLSPDKSTLLAALRYPHRQVRAAAAWCAWRVRPRAGLRRALLHGALGNDPELSAACRATLDTCKWPERAALDCLQRGRERDVYGDPTVIVPDAYAWLLRRSLRASRAPTNLIADLPAQPGSLLYESLRNGAIRDYETLEELFRYGEQALQAEVIGALPFCGDACALELALNACRSHTPGLRTAARRALRRWPSRTQALGNMLRALPGQPALWRALAETLALGLWRR